MLPTQELRQLLTGHGRSGGLDAVGVLGERGLHEGDDATARTCLRDPIHRATVLDALHDPAALTVVLAWPYAGRGRGDRRLDDLRVVLDQGADERRRTCLRHHSTLAEATRHRRDRRIPPR